MMKKLSLIFISISIISAYNQNVPNFCASTQIDGIFNYFDNILIFIDHWVFRFDDKTYQMIETPEKDSKLFPSLDISYNLRAKGI